MNIFWRETRFQVRSLIVWAIGLCAAVVILISAVFPAFNESIDSMMEVLKGFPPEFAAVFGLTDVDTFNFSWFYMFINTYISLFGAIMAASFALNVFAREKRSKSVDFLFSKPLARESIFLQKFLSVLVSLILFNAVYILVCAVMYLSAGQPRETLPELIFAAASLFFTQLVFMSVGILIAVFSKKIRSVSGTAAAVGFAGFILSVLPNLIKEDALLYIAPMKYFDPTGVFSGAGYDTKFVVTAVAVVIVCLSASYLKFTRSDAHAV